MTHSILKKSLSVLLCAVMLVSCWVFAAPQAEAATRDTYSFDFSLTTENNADCNDNGHPVLEIYGKPANGTGAEEPLLQLELDYDYIQKKNTYTYSATTNKFPTKVFLSIDFDGGGWRKWEGKFKLSVNGTYVINDTSNRVLEGANLFSHELKSMTVNVAGSYYPSIQTCNFTKKPPTSVTIPRTDEQIYSCPVAAELVDQYGVLWHDEPSISFDSFHSGVNLNDGVLTISSDANSADGSNSSFKLNAAYDVYSTSVTVSLVNASYSYEFQNEEGATISSGTLRYGQTVPKPADLTKAYDRVNHYIFQGWNPNDVRLQKDTVFKPNFKQEAHQFLTYTSDRNATCVNDGTKTSVCTCGAERTVTDEGSALGHAYTYNVTTQPTCTTPGVATYTCTRPGCGSTYSTPIAATGHTYQTEVVAPTCEAQGYTLHACQNCDESYKDNYTDALGHLWDDGVVQTPAGCTTEGTKVYTCSRCHGTQSEAIEPLGHTFKTWTIKSYATCTEDGEKFSTCSRCKEKVTQVLPAFGHSWSDWEEDAAPTCEGEGSNMRYCMICSEEEHQPIAALGHAMVETVQAPQDGKDGMIYYTCSRQGCGKCATCVINAQGEKEIGEICEPEELPESTVDIPTAAFNTYNSIEDHYNYVNRGASLRVDPNAPADKQALRFSASLLMPKGVSVVDYGYVYTNEDHFRSINSLVIGGDGVVQKSIINGKSTSHQIEQGEVKTFNIVLDINKGNWGKNYIARPYIIYQYAGEQFTVYDAMYSSRSVNYIAEKVLQSPTERQSVKDYIQSKIFA
ncbi:MAG: hypothetical protein E7517_07280 [Ruminococcaceae bacterium]|nr:hypothetical protein [Oscillospiraceae bacterium]